jgi:uncharacterized repeat protein (TIGR01451 family)
MNAEAWEYKRGDTVRYQATVANAGNVPLTKVTVTDELTGEPTSVQDLAPGEQKSIFIEYTIPADVKTGELNNHFKVTAQPEGGLKAVSAEADASVNVVEGEVAVAVDLPSDARPGDTVKGTITLENGRSKDLTSLKFTVEPKGASVDGTIRRLKAGEKLELTYEFKLAADDAPGPLTMGVRASGSSGGEAVKLDAVKDVEVARAPKLTVEQKASGKSVEPGKSVGFTASVTNDGNVPLTGVECVTDLWGIAIDPKSVKPSDSATVDAEALKIARLEPGETVRYAYEYPVSASAESGDFENNLTVTGSDELTGEKVSAQAVTDVELAARPGISLTLTADKARYAPGEDILYTLTAENTGNVPLNDVRLRDLTEGLTLTGIDASNDEGATQPEGEPAVDLPQLSTGATIAASFTAAAPAVELGDPEITITGSRFERALTNKAEVSGESAKDGDKVTAKADNAVTIEGDISLKVALSAAEESYHPGETARVLVQVLNDGDAALEGVALTNGQGLTYAGKDKGSVNVTEAEAGAAIGKLMPGEDVTLEYALSIPADYAQQALEVSATAANAYATANGALMIPVAEEAPSGQVLVKMTAIQDQVEAGEAATFDVSVTNESEYALYAVDVTAGPEGGEFTSLPEGVEASGSTVRIAELAAGQTLHLGFRVPTGEVADAGSLEASVTASGKYDREAADSVTASASAGVGVKKPAPVPFQLPMSVVIYGAAGLALLLAAGLILLMRRKKQE